MTVYRQAVMDLDDTRLCTNLEIAVARRTYGDGVLLSGFEEGMLRCE